MKILVIGSGGREHALVWKIRQSKLAEKIFCAPGNAGISQIAECVDIKQDDLERLINFAKKEKIDFTIVGPEAPLALGIVNEFLKNRLLIFGPNKQAAKLEASKVFAKEFMSRYNVPTARFEIFNSPQEAKKYIQEKGTPCVIKADGLAQGKGVVVAKTEQEAMDAVTAMMEKKIFGQAGDKIIIEDCLTGEEASILIITDCDTYFTLAPAQDHKRIFDNDQGWNTGGMGAYSPTPAVNAALLEIIKNKIIHPVITGINLERMCFSGVIYFGIMLTKEGPKVLEFNLRFGDPETQAILPRLKSDLLEYMFIASEVKLSRLKELEWDSRACVCVVCASKGYPGDYEKGKEISGVEEAEKGADVVVFHSGTKKEGKKILTNGGRVLGVAGLGSNIKEAINKTYKAVEKIKFEGMQYRKDIGRKALL